MKDQSLNALGRFLDKRKHLTELVNTRSDASVLGWVAHVDKVSIHILRMLIVHLREIDVAKVEYATLNDKVRHETVLTMGKEALREYYSLKLHEYYYHNFTPEILVEPTERCVITDQV